MLAMSSVLMFPSSIRYFFYRHGTKTLKYSSSSPLTQASSTIHPPVLPSIDASINVHHLHHSSLYSVKLCNDPYTTIHKQHPLRHRRRHERRTRPSKPSRDMLILNDSPPIPPPPPPTPTTPPISTDIFQVSLNCFAPTTLSTSNHASGTSSSLKGQDQETPSLLADRNIMTNIIVHNEIPQVPPQASQSTLVDQVHQPRTFDAGRGSGEVLLSTHPIPLENQVSPSSLEVQVLPPPLPPSPSPIIVTSDDSKIYTPS